VEARRGMRSFEGFGRIAEWRPDCLGRGRIRTHIRRGRACPPSHARTRLTETLRNSGGDVSSSRGSDSTVHGLVVIRGAVRRIVSARPLIVHFEETRICGDVLCPQTLHQCLDFFGPIIFTIWERASKFGQAHASGVWGAGMRSVGRPRRFVGNTLWRNLKLVLLNRRRRHVAILVGFFVVGGQLRTCRRGICNVRIGRHSKQTPARHVGQRGAY
jgi:hypothetical protein